ncbi:serine/threonine protein phosphatase 1 [Neolewinella xylanilytica]|uniref:Serine/threonine protein phosphatase 1 n=1 Tax=Neolewinella xylanilytica TaxID=1514080 RepID=A0A2S6IA22_9BACT|nr:metallophosphoesterase family protein [Neolewinella xylanilytica]PPK88338.1 serine/threonine protein phosphatase 1 [Neolewinella xylanilytica]
MPRYAITDIHGCFFAFQRLLDEIGFGREDELFLLGDYIDRGPDSRGVLQLVWKLQGEGYRVHCLRGNHEQMLIDAMQQSRPAWDYMPAYAERQQTLIWMQGLPLYLEIPGYVLVHAGLNFGVPDPLEDEHAMLWIRDWESETDLAWLGDRVLLYGHTPRTAAEVQAKVTHMHERKIVCLDSGCAMRHPGMGILTALNLDSGKITLARRS